MIVRHKHQQLAVLLPAALLYTAALLMKITLRGFTNVIMTAAVLM